MLLFSGESVTILKKDDWWLVASEFDWIENSGGYSIEEIFSRIIPFPEDGQNSVRGEILLKAFAQDVFTESTSNSTVIKDRISQKIRIWLDTQKNSSLKRIIAFRM